MVNKTIDPTPISRAFERVLFSLRRNIEDSIVSLIPEDETVELRTRLIYVEATFDANNDAYISSVDSTGGFVTMDTDPDYEEHVPFIELDTDLLIAILKGVELSQK